MVQRRDIDEFVQRVVERFRPEKVVLFGSYAYGTPTEDSDVDLLVVTHREPAGPSVATCIRTECLPNFPLDILVRTKREIKQRLQWHDFFLMDVFEKGIPLYDASNKGVAAKGRSRRCGCRTPDAFSKASVR